VTRVLGKQVPLAALLAAEAGDSLPAALQERVATALAAWVVDAPSTFDLCDRVTGSAGCVRPDDRPGCCFEWRC
jgi:hypothetical protein